ncbi:hypothetical protein [Cellulosimicrobium marinum]|uniref:hypothetical protein n=1 Tax=Cellulosimicrobium marinum TaxID=1638992 RepID=UPI001E371C2D|nr:hypothetical protein [Cellulosimicrobium marinum]MCB7135296.1 hypothetical protein [Cellulosimicrobium marinum]
MPGQEQHPEESSPRHDRPTGGVHRAPGSPAPWEHVVARFQGDVAEVSDPLTWGLDLDEETLTGWAEDAPDPTDERFLRSYVSFAGETLDVETLRVRATDTEADEIVRTALSGALAAPLDAEAGDDDHLLDNYQAYRAAMRAIVDEVDRTPLEDVPFVVDDVALPSRRGVLRDRAAVYVVAGGRGVVVSGPVDLVDQVDVVTGPLRAILHDDEQHGT